MTYSLPHIGKRRKLDKEANIITRRIFFDIIRNNYISYSHFDYMNRLLFMYTITKHENVVFTQRVKNFLINPRICRTGLFDFRLENCECIDQVDVQISYCEDCHDVWTEGFITMKSPNILFLTCVVPIDFDSSYYQKLYMSLVGTVRHELQHSYQTFFLRRDEAIELGKFYRDISQLKAPSWEKERQYMHQKLEIEAKIKQWTLQARKKNMSWQRYMNVEINKKIRTLSMTCKTEEEKKQIRNTYEEIKKQVYKFYRKYGRIRTYLAA